MNVCEPQLSQWDCLIPGVYFAPHGPQHLVRVMSFRAWLNDLRLVRGNRPLWPVLLGAALNSEFLRQVAVDEGYKGEVFINRDDHPLQDGDREERLVASLYRTCHCQNHGCVILANQPVWLLGFQWPNQGGAREKGRRADLVGITLSGGVVVFEAKRADGEAPLIALAEGLDYLACFLRERNFNKLLAGFQKWKAKPGRIVPPGFERSTPTKNDPTLVILAPERYYRDRHSRSIRSKDWPFLFAAAETMIPAVRVCFACTDFKSTVLSVPRLPT